MPDVLAHVLVGYALGSVLAARYDRLTSAHVSLVMIGALSPDFVKIGMVVPGPRIEALLGIPFDWMPLHTLGGSALVVAFGTLLVAPGMRKRTAALLAIGAGSHLFLDFLLLTPSGYAYPVLFPLTASQPPAPNLYLSTDRWPTVVAAVLAVAGWFVRSRSLRANRG